MKRTLTLIILALFIGIITPQSLPVFAAQTDATISINSPAEGDVILGHNAEFSGKGPKSTLINIEITDSDTSRPLVEHQQYGHVSGTTTSDTNGDWVFVPQQELVPGKFTIQASYATADAQPQTVKSEIISFTVVDNEGSSGRLSVSLVQILIAGGVAGVLIIALVFWLRRRRKKRNRHHEETEGHENEDGTEELGDEPDKEKEAEDDQSDSGTSLFLRTPQGQQFIENESKHMNALDAEAMKIEEELAEAAEQLERTNAQVAQLRHEIASHNTSISPQEPLTPPAGIPHQKLNGQDSSAPKDKNN